MTATDSTAWSVRAVGALASVAVTVKVVPDPVGVPVMVPVAPLRLSPAGSFPLVTAQLTGAVPPVEARVAPGYTSPSPPPGSEPVVMLKRGAGDGDAEGGRGGLGRRSARVGGGNRERGDHAGPVRRSGDGAGGAVQAEPAGKRSRR